MKEAEDQFRTMIDTIPALAWSCRPDGAAEFLNQRWLDFTGLSLEQAEGTGWNVSIHPEDLGTLMETWVRLLVSGQPGEVEARLRRFDGEYRWFLFRAVPVRDDQGTVVRWYGTSTDIENLKRAEEKLRQDERELRQIVDTVAQLVIFLRPDGSALHANRFTLEYTGLSLEDLKAKDFRERVFHPDDVERLREERRKALLA